MSEPDLDEMRQRRPGERATNTGDEESLTDLFKDALDEVDAGGSNKKTLSVREEDLAAFARGLERDGEKLVSAVEKLQEARGKGDGTDRQDLIINAAWVGFKQVCGEEVEAFKDAKAERARDV